LDGPINVFGIALPNPADYGSICWADGIEVLA
jgi:hypothetical protein